MRLILKKSKFNVDFKNAKKLWQQALAFLVNCIQLVAVSSPYYYENTRSRQTNVLNNWKEVTSSEMQKSFGLVFHMELVRMLA